MNDLAKILVLVVIVFLLSYGLSGCTHNPCDNPRNMSCMTADEIERELNV